MNFNSIKNSGRACLKGVRWKSSSQMFEINLLRWSASLSEQVEKGTYKSKGFNNFTINERGKTRKIQSVHISERCVQKALCVELKPILLPKLAYDNSASIKGKGTEFAINRMKCHLDRHFRKHGKKGGILIMDFKNYFGSISHEILLKKLREDIKDDKIYNLCAMFINNFDGDYGIGLGSEISQICAVYYPNSLDKLIKEELKMKGSGRYMDDSYLIHEDIDYLKECLEKIKVECDKLKLTLNPKRTRIISFGDNCEYLKKRIYMTNQGKIVMRLTRKNITKTRQKLKKQKKMLSDGIIDKETIKQSYKCWRGYADKYDTYLTTTNMDELYREIVGGENE